MKGDAFGRVTLVREEGRPPFVERDVRPCRFWIRPFARRLLRREARALALLADTPCGRERQVPRLLSRGRNVLTRAFLEGTPMREARPSAPAYYRAARRLVCRLHRAGIAHNDLHKEENWLVTPGGAPALLDFQVASVSRRRGRWFRLLGREDLRHLLKHKRTYCPEALRPRERRIVSSPSFGARLLRATGKRVYNLVTRRLLRWSDREGRRGR